MNNQKHYAAAISAFAIWGFFSIPLRALKGFGAGEILYFRILFSAIILILIILIARKAKLRADVSLFKSLTKNQKLQIIGITLAGGALLVVNWLTFIYVINTINIKTASFSYFICPVITAVLGHYLLRERLTSLQWTAVGFCLVSCVLMGLNSTLELGYSIIVAVSYALYLVSQRKNVGFDRLTTLLVQILFAFIILNILYSNLITSVPTSINFYLIVILIAGLFTVTPLFLNL